MALSGFGCEDHFLWEKVLKLSSSVLQYQSGTGPCADAVLEEDQALLCMEMHRITHLTWP